MRGERVPAIARAWIIPRGTDSQAAEAWGARMGLDLPDEAGAGLGPAVIVGDNLPVVRYCCDAGRLRRPQLRAILGAPLVRCACSGREVSWVAARRRFNAGADRAATEACELAAHAAEQGRLEAHCVMVRH